MMQIVAKIRLLPATIAMIMAWSALIAPARAEFGPDVSITRTVNRDAANGLFDDTMKGASHIAVPALVPIGLALGGGDHGRRAALLVSATAILAFGETQLLKLVVGRPRPFHSIPDLRFVGKVETDGSFPSGHAAVAFGIATILSEQYPELWVQCLSYSLASVIGFSRIYLGQHYLTDVLAGAALGYGTARGVLWLRDVLGFKEEFGPAPTPQVSWTAEGSPTVELSWRFRL